MSTKSLFTYLLSLFSMATYAQDLSVEYRSFAQEGKAWEIQMGGFKENTNVCRVGGDTLIGGERWKKIYNSESFPWNPDSFFRNVYYMAVRDEGKKVYAIAKGSSRPRLLYDFGLEVGDIVRCGMEGNAFGCLLGDDEAPDTLLGFPLRTWLRVERIDTIKARGLEHRRFTLTILDPFKYAFYGEKGAMSDNVIWIEGVGSGFGPFSPWMPLPPERCLKQTCKMGNTCIFADFYEDSDMANRGDGNADVNGDGKVDVADIARVIDSMAGQTGK